MIDMREFKRPPREPDLEVEVTLYPTEAGGRNHPLWQGCRLPQDFGLSEELNDGMYEFIGEPPSPGGKQKAYVWLLVPERNRGRLFENFQYRIWEGKFVGTGKIIRVINPILNVDEIKDENEIDTPIGILRSGKPSAATLCDKEINIEETKYPPFDEAEVQLQEFLTSAEWPEKVTWVSTDDIAVLGQGFVVHPRKEGRGQAIESYSKGIQKNLGILLTAVCRNEHHSYCAVWVPSDQTEAEYALMPDGVKLSVPKLARQTKVINGQLKWLWLRKKAKPWRLM